MKKKHTQTVVFHAVEKAATKRERVVCVCVCVCVRARAFYTATFVDTIQFGVTVRIIVIVKVFIPLWKLSFLRMG